jgi:GNAT superfamily N-acetyltransferase
MVYRQQGQGNLHFCRRPNAMKDYDTIRIETLVGRDFRAALSRLAELRVEVFRDWPYLYDGTRADEQSYLDRFAATDGAVIVAAYDGATIVGCATAVPLLDHDPAFAAPFLQAGYDATRIFYFGESVLLPAFRRRGVGHAFFDHREAAARRVTGVTHTAFCGVQRPHDHPDRPMTYVPLDAFWRKRGYAKLDGVIAHYDWTDVGQTTKTAKAMQFWMRAL